MPDDLKTLRAAAHAVAPLPWRTILHEDDRWYVADANGDDVACCDDARYGESLARYLVAAANQAEALEVARLRGLLERACNIAARALENVEGDCSAEEGDIARIRREGGLTDE